MRKQVLFPYLLSFIYCIFLSIFYWNRYEVTYLCIYFVLKALNLNIYALIEIQRSRHFSNKDFRLKINMNPVINLDYYFLL